MKFIMVVIFRDTISEIGANGTDMLILYARFRYPRNCFRNAICKQLARQRYLSQLRQPRDLGMEMRLTDGRILNFDARLRYLTEDATLDDDGMYNKYVSGRIDKSILYTFGLV